ncbi:PepSY domain-containing protein [Pseudomonas abietaniphila]|uniref:Sulfite reductase (NADPH) flavoprotein alpha-component n=1 Tax=Pseudomonas abietaniphila TaxID=89065 RepID=A0A1G8KDN0_9PSED|nr:PepSY domain-containing protein [Pseudomonas abietaniphila]SDI41489.1 sulfite reductase (NADPH) flavoprotein alpha-component [Pseudomonas abietaniphila]
MLRQFHSLPGLIAALLVMVLSISGVILSTTPALERLGAPQYSAGQINVAQLAGRVAEHFTGVEQIQRKPSGAVIVSYTRDGKSGADQVDPSTGSALAADVPSPFLRVVKDLHRSLLMGSAGRFVACLGAVFMLVLSVSGALLLARRQGGWRKLLRPLRGSFNQRWHSEVGRLAIVGLLLTSVTGVYLYAVTCGVISDGIQNELPMPAPIDNGPVLPVEHLAALQQLDLNDLRELIYPLSSDPQAMFTLETADGDGYVDRTHGALLAYQAHTASQRVYEWIYLLHTGDGLWWVGLILGICALSVPLMSVTGMLIWWRRRSALPASLINSAADSADCVLLVGSENNTTWGFAHTLHQALIQAGYRVHSAPMNQLANDYRAARLVIVLTATHGEGGAPACANQFLPRLARSGFMPGISFAVLGFGDRQFPGFCQFAEDVQQALVGAGGSPLLELERINRQSAQAFTRWGDALGEALGQPIRLQHKVQGPATRCLILVERAAYGAQVGAPTHILRFRSDGQSDGAALPRYQVGDLLGILPLGQSVPRFYSLASNTEDGVLEICVRKHEQGVCSGYLHALQVGEPVQAFIQPNPQFRPASGAHPLILIGAGTGIGPLAGFIRHNTARAPMHLYWGGRHPASDFLYEPELKNYLADNRLTALRAAFSQANECHYVQDTLIGDAAHLRHLIGKNAQIMVCGGREMAKGVMHAVDEILGPLNLSVLILKAQGRYREDVY